MAKTKTLSSQTTTKKSRPPLTPEAQENLLISKAVKLAERQLDDGTASSQVITHFLKLGTQKAQLEIEKLRHETEMIKAKTEALESMKHTEELYADALKAMRTYSGNGDPDD